MAQLSVTPITPSIGAEIDGIDLANDLHDPSIVASIRAAFLEHHVLVFRDQELSPEQHKDFARRFGSLHIHPSQRRPGATGDPEIFVVEADEKTVLNNGGLWHTDVSCDEIPPLGSMLLLTDAPADGGDTLFTNMHVAFETLSEPIRHMLEGLWAHHDQRQDLRRYGHEPRAGVDYPSTRHPVVVAHPETGRPTLFVNAAFTTHIEGLSSAESRAVLDLLYNHIAGNPVAQCRVKWQPGTLTFWDNRSTQHYAVWDYFPQHRRGERVTISGETRPKPASVV
ncbi:MAG: TauD/TfdA dioxygenase family protein [Acidimicrobiales bacterium]